MPIDLAEYNTIVTFLGMLCATVQGTTGFYAAYYLKKPFLLKSNDVLFRSHRAFGAFATLLYMLGLFNGLNSFVGALRIGEPPLELNSISFNVHTWPSFLVIAVFAWKTHASYFDKKQLYGKRKWLGIALFLAWTFTWITAAISYYLRTLPSNPQHPPPSFLLPYGWLWLQLILPFAMGGLIGGYLVTAASRGISREG